MYISKTYVGKTLTNKIEKTLKNKYNKIKHMHNQIKYMYTCTSSENKR